MATKARRHIHKYYKATVAGVKVWACALPECTHYMPSHMEDLVNGKASVCWTCDSKFILNPSNMHTDKPICEECETERLVNTLHATH